VTILLFFALFIISLMSVLCAFFKRSDISPTGAGYKFGKGFIGCIGEEKKFQLPLSGDETVVTFT
jgi:hypothetical protein